MNSSEIAAAIERIVTDVAVQIKDDVVVALFSKLHDDLGMDGLDFLEIEHALNARFGITLDEDIDLRFSVADLINLVTGRLREKAAREARAPDIRAAWLGE
jgi:acyl carrier protein